MSFLKKKRSPARLITMHSGFGYCLQHLLSVQIFISCCNRRLISCKGSRTFRISHFMQTAASPLSHLMITLWWIGNSQQCYHNHAGMDRHADCTTSTFTASDSPNDLRMGFKLSENWERGACVSYSLKEWAFLWTGFGWMDRVSVFCCV